MKVRYLSNKEGISLFSPDFSVSPLDVVSMHGSHHLSSSSVLAMQALNLKKTYGRKTEIAGSKVKALISSSSVVKAFISISQTTEDNFNKICL